MEVIGNYLYAAGVKNAIITLPYEKHTQNISILHDSIKEYHIKDARTAAYMACGMAIESLQPVALLCEYGENLFNYFSGLTEAYYRKLPLIVISFLYKKRKSLRFPNDIFTCHYTIELIQNEKELPTFPKHLNGPIYIEVLQTEQTKLQQFEKIKNPFRLLNKDSQNYRFYEEENGSYGYLSRLIGFSLDNKSQMCFGYTNSDIALLDMNSLGNRHIDGNLIIAICSGKDSSAIKSYVTSLGYAYYCLEHEEDIEHAIQTHIIGGCNTPLIIEYK